MTDVTRNEPAELLPVTQDDVDAAQALYETIPLFAQGRVKARPGHDLVQAFAQHRINHTRPASTEPADALREAHKLLRRADSLIDRVRRGGHWIGPSWGDETDLWRAEVLSRLNAQGEKP